MSASQEQENGRCSTKRAKQAKSRSGKVDQKIMDLMMENRVKNFAREYGFEGDAGSVFEKYIAKTYLNKEIGTNHSLIEEVISGGGADAGIDIAAIIVNGKIMTDPSDVADAIEDRDENAVRVCFIQCKTAEKYDTKLISKFLHGVERMATLVGHGRLDELEAGIAPVGNILRAVIDVIEKFDTPIIPCELYYVTTSVNSTEALGRESQITDAIKRIRDLGLFQSDLAPNYHGKNDINERVAEASGPQNVKIEFAKKETIPLMDGVDQAYIGLLPVREFLKIISDGQKIRPGIFDDNVRLYQGDVNPVNQQISATLRSASRNRFPFLNNGVTLVARKMSSTMETFVLSGYQIVNGCQTSHEIYEWARDEGLIPESDAGCDIDVSDLWVPVKLICTTSTDVLEDITVATNRQTPIAATDIQASNSLAKEVEEFFAQSGNEGLRYARQGAFSSEKYDVPRLRVVETADLNRAVAACAFGESSVAIGQPNTLKKEDSYVWGNNPVQIYYFAAWIVYKVERYFARANSPTVLKPAKYHIAMMVAATVLPSLRAIYDDRKDRKAMKKVETDLAQAKWEGELERAIEDCVSKVSSYFGDIVDEKGALVKDDVRAKRIQSELLDLLES